MGKGTDKLYITHSEWSSSDAFGASSGAASRSSEFGTTFKRLSFNYCALSLQPFKNPVCTIDGTTFELTHILPWIKKHGTNPVNGQPLKFGDLIKLKYTKNENGDFIDPVTFKVLTDNTHVVAIKTSGNVFSWETVERLNVKAKIWNDLVSDTEFARKDIITLQDPLNLESRDLNAFKFLKEGTAAPKKLEDVSAEQVLIEETRKAKARDAVALSRASRDEKSVAQTTNAVKGQGINGAQLRANLPHNASLFTNGQAAASFTSTGLTPHTSAERKLLSREDLLLRPRTIKSPSYARLNTTHGPLTLELYPEFAPRACWNFIQLCKRGSYDGLIFHRNIQGFMIQGGDPTGTGKGGKSIWEKTFKDELDGPKKFDSRGVLAMANKGKDTNTSQFFLTYKPVPHLQGKHTIFGHVLLSEGSSSKDKKKNESDETGRESADTLRRLEDVEVEKSTNRPLHEVKIRSAVVLIDSFEEYENEKIKEEERVRNGKLVEESGGTEDDRVTWTGKRVRGNRTDGDSDGGAVGKYLKTATDTSTQEAGQLDAWENEESRPKKAKTKGGFGNFDGW